MWVSLAHNEQFGPKAAAYRTKSEEASVGMTPPHSHGSTVTPHNTQVPEPHDV